MHRQCCPASPESASDISKPMREAETDLDLRASTIDWLDDFQERSLDKRSDLCVDRVDKPFVKYDAECPERHMLTMLSSYHTRLHTKPA